MTRRFVAVVALALLLTAASCSSAAGGGGGASGLIGQLTDIGAGLQGPAGLTASAYGRAPTNVAALAFDSSGRLWISTAAYDDKGSDGVYLMAKPGAAAVRVIGGLHTPLGLLWSEGTLYVASKERVDAYSGLVGTRFTRRRTVLTLPAGVGESNSLVLAPDGRFQLGISAPCDHCTPASRYSASIVSFRPDGSDLRVDASDVRAPIGLGYYPHMSDLFVTMDQRDDLGTRTPGDWLAVVRRGEDWRFPACYGQGGTTCAGTPSPVAVLDAHAGVDGVAIVTGQLGCEPGQLGHRRRVEHREGPAGRVDPPGNSYTGEVAAFLTGIEHPSAVVIAPSGALLVADWSTGTIFQIEGRAEN